MKHISPWSRRTGGVARVAGAGLLLRRAAIHIVLSLAVLAAAFAHRPTLPLDVAPDLSAYVLPDGTLPVICTVDADGDASGSAAGPCEFCRIWASVIVPLPQGGFERLAARAVEAILVERGTTHVRPILRRAAPPRAPPVFLS